MRQVLVVAVLLAAASTELGAQGPLLLHSAVGFGVLTRGESDRSTEVLILEGGLGLPVGPLTIGPGALWGFYETLDPSTVQSRVSHVSLFAEAGHDFRLGGSPYLMGVAGRVGYDVQNGGDVRDQGLMYGGSIQLGRRLSERVALTASGLATWYSFDGAIGAGRLTSVRLGVQLAL